MKHARAYDSTDYHTDGVRISKGLGRKWAVTDWFRPGQVKPVFSVALPTRGNHRKGPSTLV